MITKKINTKEDLYEVIDALELSQENTIVVKDTDKNYIGGIYYSKKYNEWRYYHNCFAVYPIDDYDMLHILSLCKELTFIKLPNSNHLSYEIRQHIMISNYDNMTNDEHCLPHIIKEVKSDLYKPIMFMCDNYGILIGCSATLEDYYYIYLTPDMKLQCASCVGSYTVLTNIPDNLKELMSNPNLYEIITLKKQEYFLNRSEVCML